MTTAREEILIRIGSVERALPPPVPRTYRRTGELEAPERVRLFAERVDEYRADVRMIPAGELKAAVAAACREHRVARLGVPAGFPSEWRPHEVEVVEDRGLDPRQLDAIDAVATGCTVAIAETGTIVLAGGASEGRRALTLVPDLHICVIRADQIVELVPETTEILGRLVREERRPLTYISGPSATSDIELSRVEGVHGPRTLVALIATEEER